MAQKSSEIITSIPPLVLNNPRESGLLPETLRIMNANRAERLREATKEAARLNQVPINAPLYNRTLGRR
jgi:hypothetical protein